MTPGVRLVRVLLVDDEALARRRLRALLRDEPRVEIVGEADSGTAAVKLLGELDVDLVFLDIQMPGLDGFGVMRAVPPDELPLVVFITAYDEHAVKAFDVNAVDYVLKPVVESRFRLAVDRAIERLERPRAEITAAVMSALQHIARPAESERIPIRTEKGVTFIRATDLDWAEVDGSSVRLHVGRETHVIREAMGEFEQRVPASRFLRIHRSRLVNLDRVKEVQPWFKGDFVLILHDGTRLVSGRTYRDRVRQLLRMTARAMPLPEGDRIVSIDILRGVAVLGILIMNVQYFSMPGDAYLNPTAYGDLTGANRMVWTLSHLFADQKFISIFSMLFGAGIVLMAERAGPRATVLHYRRMVVLIAFGLVHAHLLWSGDVLFSYGVVGLLVYLARKWTPRRLIIVGLLLHAGSSLIFVASGLSLASAPPETVAEVARDFWLSPPADMAKEIAAFRGGWLAQQTMREPDARTMETFIFLIDIVWKVSGLMLVGMALYKLGVLGARRSDVFYRRLAASGFGIGLPIVALGVWLNFRAGWTFPYSLFLGSQFNYWGSVVVALGWIGLVMRWCRSGRLLSLQRRLAAVGRMAFSNYIMHTVICTLIFYGTGLGLFGRVERVGQFAIVVAIWVVQLVLSPLWLRGHEYGPLEWLWRSLTYGRMEQLRRSGVEAPA